MDLLISLPTGTVDELEEALKEAIGEGGRLTASGGSSVEFKIDDRLSREKVLGVVKATLTLLGVKRAKIILAGVEGRFP